MAEIVLEIVEKIQSCIAELEEKSEKFSMGLHAPCHLSVIYKNPGIVGYRTAAMKGDERFVLSGVRQGKRSSLIFELLEDKDEDRRSYKTVEIEEKKIFTNFPKFEPELVKMLGFNPDDTSWESAKKKYIYRIRKRIKAEEKAVEEAEQEEFRRVYGDNSLFGAFS